MLPAQSIDPIASIVAADRKNLIRVGRVKTPADAVAIYQRDYRDDFEATRQRALCQEMFDGAPPYSEPREKARGQHGRTNVNWGFGSRALDEAVAPFNDILDAIADEFCTLPTSYGDEASRTYWEPVMAEEFTVCLLEWPEFHSLWQENARLFVAEGLSFAFFEDDINWEWRVLGQQHLKFPRRTRASVEMLDHISTRVDMLPHQLFRNIENESAASDEGWNVEEVRRALIECARETTPPGDDWQAWAARWKNNDLSMASSALGIPTVHLWVKELNGTASRYICRLNGDGGWLYKSEGRYHSLSRHLIAYQRGVGSNGDFHSIRGLGSAVFSATCAINRTLCKFMDMAVHTSTPHLQAENEDATNDIPLIPMGPYLRVSSGYQFVETKAPDLAHSLMPLLDVVQSYAIANSGRFLQGAGHVLDRTERTKYEKQMQYEREGSLSSANMNLFFSSWERHLKEIVRRWINQHYTSADAGGWLVHQWRARCMKRGVPAEALLRIDVARIKVNTGFGKGSATERAVIMDRIQQLYPRMDAFGQQKLNQMMAASLVGVRKARMLFPDEPGLRPPSDAQFAELENNDLVSGLPIAVQPNQNHEVHIVGHMGRLNPLMEQFMNGELAMKPAIDQMQPIWEHSLVHLEALDPTNPNRPAYKEALEQAGQVILNYRKKIDAEEMRKREAGTGGNGLEGGSASGHLLMQATQAQLRLDEAQAKLASAEAFHQQKLRHKELEFQQNQQIKDAQAAVEIASR